MIGAPVRGQDFQHTLTDEAGQRWGSGFWRIIVHRSLPHRQSPVDPGADWDTGDRRGPGGEGGRLGCEGEGTGGRPALTIPRRGGDYDRWRLGCKLRGFSGDLGLRWGFFCGMVGLSGCSAVASALRSGRRGRWFESTHPDHWACRLRPFLRGGGGLPLGGKGFFVL